MTEPVTKPLPVAMSVKPEEPAVTELGLMDVSVGTVFGLMVKFNALDVGNPGVATVIEAVPESKSKLAGTCAIN